MGNFKKVCRLYRLTGTWKLVLSGLIGLFIMQVSLSLVDIFEPETARDMLFFMNIRYWNGMWLVMMLGNLDVGGKTRLLYTSKMRRYIYSKFYPLTAAAAMLALFLLDFAVKCTVGSIVGTDISVWGGRSIMAAIFIGLGFLVMGLLSVMNAAAGVILCIGVLLSMLVVGLGAGTDMGEYIPLRLSGSVPAVLIAGILIILLGAAAFRLLRERGYRKASSPVSSAAKEQAAIEAIEKL